MSVTLAQKYSTRSFYPTTHLAQNFREDPINSAGQGIQKLSKTDFLMNILFSPYKLQQAVDGSTETCVSLPGPQIIASTSNDYLVHNEMSRVAVGDCHFYTWTCLKSTCWYIMANSTQTVDDKQLFIHSKTISVLDKYLMLG